MSIIADGLKAFWNVFAAMSPWLLVNLLPDALPAGFSALALQECTPSAVNHISGVVLALIMLNAFFRPPKMR